MISEIKEKINKEISLKDKINEIDSMLKNHKVILDEDDINELESEKERLKSLSISENLSFSKKYNNFMFKIDEIENANEIKWLVENIVPAASIGLFYGPSGSGKSILLLRLCRDILNNDTDVNIIYIDGDMSIEKLKEREVHLLMKEFNNRFNYYGKDYEDFSEKSQELIKDIAKLQKKNKDKIYVVVEDSLLLTAAKKFSFIDTEKLYKNEKELRKYGGSAIIIHHTNKKNVFADSQQIENFADYSFRIKRNDFNSTILIEKDKASRFDIKNFAYKVENRKIVEKIDYEIANIDNKVIVFIKFVREALEDTELNQSELIKYLEEVRYFSNAKIGKTKAMKMLKKYAKIGKWSYEQRVDKKNSIVYYLNDSKKAEKLEKLKNTKGFEDEIN